MTTLTLDSQESKIPTPAESEAAKQSSRQLLQIMAKSHAQKLIQLSLNPWEGGLSAQGHLPRELPNDVVTIPTAALRMLNEILVQMAEGNTVTIIPIHAELTTQEAADLMNVSRPYLIEQLEHGKIPFHKVGAHRRIRFKDLMEYKKVVDAQREKAMDEMASDAQELGLY